MSSEEILKCCTADEDDDYSAIDNPAFDDATPPPPPPRSSSICTGGEESPKKEITIVVHMVQKSLDSASEGSSFNYLENFNYTGEPSRSLEVFNYPEPSTQSLEQNSLGHSRIENFNYPEPCSRSLDTNCPGSSRSPEIFNYPEPSRQSIEQNSPGPSTSPENYNYPEPSRNLETNCLGPSRSPEIFNYPEPSGSLEPNSPGPSRSPEIFNYLEPSRQSLEKNSPGPSRSTEDFNYPEPSINLETNCLGPSRSPEIFNYPEPSGSLEQNGPGPSRSPEDFNYPEPSINLETNCPGPSRSPEIFNYPEPTGSLEQNSPGPSRSPENFNYPEPSSGHERNNEVLLSIPNLIASSRGAVVLPDLLVNVGGVAVERDNKASSSSGASIEEQAEPTMSHEEQHDDSADEDGSSSSDSASAGFIPRFVRASMRRVRRFRLSTRNQPIIDQSADDPIEINNEDSSADDVSSTITDRISDSAPELPPPRQSATVRPTPSPLGPWPFDTCFALAALGCTAGLFNLSRFAVHCVQFGGPFLIQFLVLSVLFGIPLFLFHVALGHYLGAGVMDMWRISPVFQGVGIALLAGQALIGLYSIVGVSWLFVFFRDSFVTRATTFKWAQPFPLYRGTDILSTPNQTQLLEETVPDYFSGVVLQRYNLSSPDRSFGHFKFQVAFNLAVVWIIVFVSLSKGLKSYGRVLFLVVGLPILGVFILCCQVLSQAAATSQSVFPETAWEEIISNTQSWIAASTEVFFTWGLLGIASMQAASHVSGGGRLLRDSVIVAGVTLIMLVFVAFLADACNQILLDNGYLYVHTSSFEHMSTAQFLKPLGETMVSTRQVPHSSLFSGTRLVLPGSSSRGRRSLSGYQALRLATEMLPATFAVLGIKNLSVFWPVTAYFSLILFGVAQQLAIWHSVITGIIAINARSLKSWETTITFFTCAFGYILGLPLTTELGIWVVYFLDTVVGSGWWLALLHCLMLVAVLVIRGRPYNGETLAGALFGGSCAALRGWLSFVWSVILPIILLVLSVVLFRTSESGELYDWSTIDRLYWPVWARELGSILQLLPVLVVPLVAMVQTCRYLANGPPDLFDRIELLYRPAPGSHSAASGTARSLSSDAGPVHHEGTSEADPPPKYTPPPSYTTATGARIAKLLRESIRRSMRRLAPTSATSASSSEAPPDYAAVLVEMRDTRAEDLSLEIRPTPHTLPAARSRTLTAPEVAQILRSGSLRRSRRYDHSSSHH